MPKILRARPAQEAQEERQVRKLAGSRHGPADWIQHAKMVVSSWEGTRVEAIAAELHCSALTVRRRLHRFDTEGFEGLGDRPRAGRPRRLTPADDSALIALVHTAPPGRLERERDGTLVARDEKWEAHWSLAALAQAAKDAGIPIKRSQLGPVVPRTFPPARGWSVDGHRIKAPLDYLRGPEKTWIYGALRVRDGKELTRCAPARNSRVHRAPGCHRSGQSQGGAVPDHRQPVESHQPGDADLAGGASAPAPCVHPD